MANYTNLTTLDGLVAGDIIEYNTSTAIDFKGYKVKIEMLGGATGGSKQGGTASFDMDSSVLPQSILKYHSIGALVYGNTDNLLYMIAAPGNAGNGGIARKMGGSTVGCKQGLSYDGGGPKNTSDKVGDFAFASSQKGADINPGRGAFIGGGQGGFGWFGGKGTDALQPGNVYTGGNGSGGSGGIIGMWGIELPSNYFENDGALRNKVNRSILSHAIKKAASTSFTPKMIVTIVSTPVTQSVIHYYTGTEFKDANIHYFDGTKFNICDMYYFNGTTFEKM